MRQRRREHGIELVVGCAPRDDEPIPPDGEGPTPNRIEPSATATEAVATTP